MALFSLPYQLSPRADRVTLRWLVERGGETGVIECESGRAGPVRKRSLATLACDVCEQRITGLAPDQRVRYRLQHPAGATPWYTARTLPAPDAPVRILVTSDAQSMPLVPSALAGARRHFGEVDFILYPGDLADRPWRREDWCAPLETLAPEARAATATRGFFPSFQGWARAEGGGPAGAPYLQSTPLYAMPGNHEVYGPRGFHDLVPRSADPDGWSIDVFSRLFLPWTRTARPYYAVRHGNVAVIALFVARAWRPGGPDDPQGAIYREPEPAAPGGWHHGCFTFESIAPGSRQYNWLLNALATPEFQTAALRIVALHHPIFTGGHDARPRFIEPVAQTKPGPMGVSERTYAYPEEQELLERFLVPLFERTGVQLVVNGHSHVYSRYTRHGIQYLETSNLGNTYGWDAPYAPNAQLESQHHSNTESYLTLVSTEGDNPIGQSICAQDGRTIDRFSFDLTQAQPDRRIS